MPATIMLLIKKFVPQPHPNSLLSPLLIVIEILCPPVYIAGKDFYGLGVMRVGEDKNCLLIPLSLNTIYFQYLTKTHIIHPNKTL